MLPCIDLEPHSSSSPADSGKLSQVAWRAIFHHNRCGSLPTGCFRKRNITLFKQNSRKIQSIPLNHGDRGSLGLHSNHYCQKTGDGEENVRPAALLSPVRSHVALSMLCARRPASYNSNSSQRSKCCHLNVLHVVLNLARHHRAGGRRQLDAKNVTFTVFDLHA